MTCSGPDVRSGWSRDKWRMDCSSPCFCLLWHNCAKRWTDICAWDHIAAVLPLSHNLNGPIFPPRKTCSRSCFFPFCLATVTQARPLAGKHVNNISTFGHTGSNPHKCAKKNRPKNTCCLIQVLRLTPNQAPVHWLPSVRLSRPEHRWILQTRRQQEVVLTFVLRLAPLVSCFTFRFYTRVRRLFDQIRLDGFIFLIYWRNSCLQQH